MAGLAESSLRNLRSPGNPFAGFFGMHRALNKGPYRGFARDPELQLRWFTDTAVAVRQRAIAEGDEDFGRPAPRTRRLPAIPGRRHGAPRRVTLLR
jgi:hypothetical protein